MNDNLEAQKPRTHYQLNCLVNTIVGNLPVAEQDIESLLQVVRRQRDLIADEFDELRTGVEERNISEVRDGIADVIVTVDGMFFRAGLEYPRIQLWDVHGDEGNIDAYLKSIQTDLELILEMIEEAPEADVLGPYRHRLEVYCCSILYACYCISSAYGIDLQADQVAVFVSNMSKFDTDLDTARKGVEKYANIGVQTDIFPSAVDGQVFYVLKCVHDTVGADGKKYSLGKFLKSVLFKEPVLPELPADAPIHTLLAA